jgi:predicted nucleic acid-binding protein
MAEDLTPVTIDAGLGVALVVPLEHSERATDRVLRGVQRGAPIYVPALWEYEVTSALHRAVLQGLLTPEWATSALTELLSIGIVRVPPEPSLHQEALRLAADLGLECAEDAHYLAVAARHGAHCWTTSPTLARAARAAGLAWVSWIGDEGEEEG